jgi:hypothetical protein
MGTPASLDSSDRSSGALQMPSDQSSAFSQELQRLSQPTPVADQAAPPSPRNNSAVENLPSVATPGQAPKADATAPHNAPDDHKLHGWGNNLLNIGYAGVAMVAADAAIGLAAKNPELMGMAVKSLAEGGKIGLITDPRYMIGMGLLFATTMGGATAARHYTVGALGKSESWMDSANQIGLGSVEYYAGTKIGSKIVSMF